MTSWLVVSIALEALLLHAVVLPMVALAETSDRPESVTHGWQQHGSPTTAMVLVHVTVRYPAAKLPDPKVGACPRLVAVPPT